MVGSVPVDTASTGAAPILCNVAMARLWIGQPVITALRQLTVMPLRDEMLFGMDALFGGVLTVDMPAGVWQWEVLRAHLRQG